MAADRTAPVPRPAGDDSGAVICAVDGSQECLDGLDVAAELAERLDRSLLLVTVRPMPTNLPSGMAREAGLAWEQTIGVGRRILAELSKEPPVSRLGGRVTARVEFGDPTDSLAAVAEEVRACLIVVASRGRGPARAALLGSVSQKLAVGPSRPVVVVPPGSRLDGHGGGGAGRSRSIVCGVDGSTDGERAVRVAAQLAQRLRLRLVLVHVEKDGRETPAGAGLPAWRDARTEDRLRLLDRACDAAGDTAVETCLAAGLPAAALEVVAAREAAELIAVGTRGHGALKALTLGSTSRALAASSSRPVLVISERPSDE